MKKLFRGFLLVGTLAGAVVILKGYLGRSETAGEEAVQIIFQDGSTRSLSSNTVEGQEFTDIARKVLEIGV
ncbi:MAG: hypothetical protein H0U04_00895 [Rubrobacter sp.]|nr:hypothetical protein [Rubrobacter sp.]